MKPAALALLPLIALAPGLAAAKSKLPHFPPQVLIAEAKAAPLKLIDALGVYCDTDTPIGVWLKRLTAREARSIAWTAGKCELVDDLNPLDAGGDYCVQAVVRLKHPRQPGDTPMIELFIDDPRGGKPGPVYAFRGMFDTADGGDLTRVRKDFEAEWRERFKHTPPPPCTDDQ